MKHNWIFALLALYTEAVLGCNIYPLEILHRALTKGPLITRTTSSPDQWAGRTTLSSGSATVTVSTYSVGSDSLIFAAVQAALPAAYATQGWASVVASAATATISTTAVYSGQHIDLALVSSMNQASGVARSFRVDSVVGGVSFAIVTLDGQNVTSGPYNINWHIPQAVPQGIKVNTISPGNFFTFGWADGQSRPVDSTVLWELRRTS